VSLYFEDLEVGMRLESPARTISEADVVNFAGVSGDFNALHTDESFAGRTPFGRRIAHGMLTLAAVTGLRQRMGVFDGTLLAFLEIRSWRFLQPVFPGDTIRSVTEVADKRETSKEDRGIVIQRIEVRNQEDAVVQEGEFVTMMRRRGAA
jgi:acyl dehydratase